LIFLEILVALDFLPALRPPLLRHLNRRNAEALLIAKQFADALEVAGMGSSIGI